MPRTSPPSLTSPQSSGTARPPVFIGTSGWAYPSWKPKFYPDRTPAKRFLQSYASRLNSVEVNYTFRTLPTPAQLSSWLDDTPAGFRFSFKAPEHITHHRRLRECTEAVSKFLDALAPAHKAGKLGVLLFQLPPNFKADPERLDAFLAHTRLRGSRFPLAFEFRHASWFDETTYAVLRKRKAALCVAEGDDLITPDVTTAPHRCYRLRRGGGYTADEITAFTQKFGDIGGGDTYVYFRHEEQPTGARNALALTQQLASGHAQ